MDKQTAIILGAWIFASCTAITKNVTGWFMIVAFIFAIFLSVN